MRWGWLLAVLVVGLPGLGLAQGADGCRSAG